MARQPVPILREAPEPRQLMELIVNDSLHADHGKREMIYLPQMATDGVHADQRSSAVFDLSAGRQVSENLREKVQRRLEEEKQEPFPWSVLRW